MSDGKRFGVLSVALLTAVGVLVGGAVVYVIGGAFFAPQGTNPPIKVGGGAISFQSESSSDPWTIDGNGGYCSKFAPTQIEAHAAGENDGKANSAKIGSGVPWTIVFQGADPATRKPSGRGIQATGNDSSICSGGVHLTTLAQSGFYFYPKLLATASGLSIARFRDMSTSSCAGPNNSNDPTGPPTSGDEDVCEQLTEIDVTVGPPNNPTTQFSVACQDIRCVLHLKP
jgi:hypothetical protein